MKSDKCFGLSFSASGIFVFLSVDFFRLAAGVGESTSIGRLVWEETPDGVSVFC